MTQQGGSLGSFGWGVLAVSVLLACPANADVALPSILSDGMVVQRNTSARLWGWAKPGEPIKVSASWNAPSEQVAADAKGRWEAYLKTPDAGGPFTITIVGNNTVTIRDVLVGEVWVCSGQSNMEWALRGIGPGREGVPSAAQEVREASYPRIRFFTAPNVISAHELADAKGSWSECSPASAGDFSATGYFFGRALHKELGVPIGLISADWGGTPAESWMSADALAKFPEFESTLEMLKIAGDPARREELSGGVEQRWWDRLDTTGADAPGKGWQAIGFDDSSWKTSTQPGVWSGDELGGFDGIVCFRRVVELGPEWAGRAATLELGPIDDRDEAWVNGVLVGAMREDGAWAQKRSYTVPPGVLVSGRNVISVRVLDTGGPGGMHGSAGAMLLRSERASDAPMALAGEWKHRRCQAISSLPKLGAESAIGPGTPSALFNGMIAPVSKMTIRGAIWYQGESNVGRAAQYRDLFPALIKNWRSRWGQGDFPFYFVQIAPFGYGGDPQAAAELREAQASALSLANTGMAVTVDLGNPRDIHPDNKQEVGRRLALWALRQTYGAPGVSPAGPRFKSMTTGAGKATLTFEATGSLRAASGDIEGFFIAGADKVFHPAKATASAGRVEVSSPRVANPAAVRYAFSAAGTGNLVDESGLPAAPFRTDSWAGPLPPPSDEGRTSYLSDDPTLLPLFNGKDLSGWANVNCAPSTWRAEDGMIRCSGVPTGLLRTAKQYENFILEMEFRHLRSGGNAGLFVWSDAFPVKGQPFTRSVEVQVMDGQEGDWYTSDGDIFPIHGAVMKPENGRGGTRAFPTEKRMKLSPDWNHYRVTCNNGEVSLAVNGKMVTRGKECSPRAGYICLESEGSPVDFRNIRIKELPASEPAIPASMRAAADEGFRPLYNGVDLQGWKFEAAHEGHWKAADWTLDFDGGGDHLWTTESFADFELVCDWRWTGKGEEIERPVILKDGSTAKDATGKDELRKVVDAGDSGIYLRGNDKSQVNIWCWPVGSGEVYGYRTDASMPAEVRAGVTPSEPADAPIGQWNRFHITMKGERLTVELNGKVVIKDALLPGVPKSGPIALQMHGGALQFANIAIKELK